MNRDILVHKNTRGLQDGYNAMLDRLKTGAVSLSIELTANGVRYWATAPQPMTLIRLVARRDAVPPGMDVVDPQHGYEVINPDAPHCLYLDIEDERAGRDNDALFRLTLSVMRDMLVNTFGDAIDAAHICIDATNESKLSKHVIYPHVIFKDLRSTRAFMRKVTDRIDADDTYAPLRWPFNEKGERRVYPWVIDTSVYSRFRCFRLPLCRKRKPNSTPLTISVEQSTYVFPSTDTLERVLEATAQWRLHTGIGSQVVRAVEEPPMLSMAAAGRRNPRTSVPITIALDNWTDNVFLRTAWDAIDGQRWWPHNKKAVKVEKPDAISVYLYASADCPAFCPLKCYYMKYVTFRQRNHEPPTLLRWQPDGAPLPEHYHDNNAHVKINICAYELYGVRYLCVDCYCFRGCHRFISNLGWDCKLKDRIPFPHEKQHEQQGQQQTGTAQNSPMGGGQQQPVHNAQPDPQQPQLAEQVELHQ